MSSWYRALITVLISCCAVAGEQHLGQDAVLRNSHREAGCAEHNTAMFGVQLSLPQAKKKGCVSFFRRRRICMLIHFFSKSPLAKKKSRPLFLFAVFNSRTSLLAVRRMPYIRHHFLFIRRSRKKLTRRFSVFGIHRNFCVTAGLVLCYPVCYLLPAFVNRVCGWSFRCSRIVSF